MVEVLDSRHTKDVVPGTGRIYAKMKAYGIPIHRIHTDRERCFITTGFRDFCLNRSLYQTMTSGDTPQENGRVESEINQVKRRMRLMLSESQLPRANWPNIARWVGEQRCRAQLQQLGVPTKPMIAPGTKVMVKQKLWNKKAGALSNPYKRMTLLGPSPLMSSGWVVKDGHKVQHAKVVVIESPESEAARLELHEALPRRLHGKQAGDPDQPRLQKIQFQIHLKSYLLKKVTMRILCTRRNLRCQMRKRGLPCVLCRQGGSPMVRNQQFWRSVLFRGGTNNAVVVD